MKCIVCENEIQLGEKYIAIMCNDGADDCFYTTVTDYCHLECLRHTVA
jgi:hypothetical protein